MNKFCPKCQTDKPIEEFPVNRVRKDGRSGSCLVCQREYCKAHYQNNKPKYYQRNDKRYEAVRNLVINLKLESGCTKCGYNRCLTALHFHHLDSKTKDIGIALIARKGWSLERINAEIAKCILVCANCHAEIHELEHTGFASP